MPCLGSQELQWSSASADRRLRGTLVAGTYLIEQMVGAGAMGYVYRAVHVGLGVPCAVKVIREAPLTRLRRERGPRGDESRVGPALGRGSREVLVAQFQIEARAVGRLDHPNIVRLLDFGRDAEVDLWFLVTEHLEGQDLNDVLNAEGALPVARVVALGRQLCAALQHTHEAGVIHRDVKPDNLRLVPRRDPDGGGGELLKLIDFGTAMIVRDAAAGAAPAASLAGGAPSAEELDGQGVGTPAYMSPEQATGRRTDARSDIYSCGVLLFEMATGKLPFEMPTPIALAAAHVECDPPAPRAVNPAVDPDLERLILRCLRKDPAERPPSARALDEALEQVGAAALRRSRASAAEGPPTLRSLRGVP